MSVLAGASAEESFARALLLHEQGRLDEAEQAYMSVFSIDCGHIGALLHLTALRLQQGLHEEAIRLTRDALEREPNCAEAHSNLGTAFHLLGRHDEAVACYEAAIAIDPDRPESYYGFGLALHALRRFDEAASCFERALAIDPHYAEASCALGSTLVVLKRHDRAVECYRRALEVDSEYAEAICGLAELLHARQRHDDAIVLYRQALALRPEHPPTLNALGTALLAVGRHQAAMGLFRQALLIAPNDAGAHLYLGTALEELGEIAEAQSAFEKAVALDPRNPRCVFALINTRRVRQNDAGFAALKTLEDHIYALPTEQQILVYFALGKALSDLGEHNAAFDHMRTGNALKRSTLLYDEAGTLGMLERIKSVFTPEVIARHRERGNPSSMPIFIIGMPRSGSTLVEQILSSHASVFGGGERADLSAAAKSAGIDPAAADFPESCIGLGDVQLASFGSDYLARLRAAADAAGIAAVERGTDKMLANYCFVGLIHLALPNASIIHCRRDPVDTCMSCFSKLFSADIPYAYDLSELGRYYRAYDALMAHWHRVLPSGTILDVHYEALVSDFEPQARRIVVHCGLDWDAACLSFYETERPVRTASVVQVRQPIYQSSVGRWRPGDDLLRPLLDAL